MKVLLIGGGGREHALAWKLSQSPLLQQLFIAPGNAGTASCGTNVDLSASDFPALKSFVLDNEIGMLIVGPEAPLVAGITDYFRQESELQHVLVIGPSQEGAKLEGSKAYAKTFMQDYNIPTAAYQDFTSDQLAEALAYLDTLQPPIVLKADGLAAGKGVLILSDREQAKKELTDMLGGKFGQASERVVVEDFLQGIEFSVFALTDGTDYRLLPIAKDYKRIGEGDTGLNTGGMGAVSPVSFVDEALMQKVEEQIVRPTIQGIKEKGIDYQGFVFFGLIKVDDSPYVIEYNCRMGDPETEVVIPRLKNDLMELLIATAKGRLSEQQIQIDERAATTVMLVSGGYPGAYEKGKAISGLEFLDNSIVFHAGTRQNGDQLQTNGGRVLAITSYGENFRQALMQSNANAAKIQFEGKYFRKDIGLDLM
ncbi:MAG: phosphoribosylamine--glycine ligase [Bacteroidota bacterium]